MDNEHILIADDDPGVRSALAMLLENNDYQVTVASSPDEILASVDACSYSLLLLDLNYSLDTTSGVEGMALIPQLRALDESLPLVVMTGWGTIDLAVKTMQLGAADFVQKPWDNERLLNIVSSLIRLRNSELAGQKLRAENSLLRAQIASGGDRVLKEPALIAESPQMRRVLELIARVADSDVSILLSGENGTGKSLLARHAHQSSNRHKEAFISINMGSISENLFESEMFGHVKGAFTDARETRMGRFELAHRGTLFLDEIGNTPVAQQAKLLRVLEDNSFEKVGSSRTQYSDVRLISATNMDLKQAVSSGQFRTDLFYRINTLEIEIPPLRDRPDDVVPLAEHFLGLLSAKYHKENPGLSIAGGNLLKNYSWPGNVRELHHVMERAVLLSGTGPVDIASLIQGRDAARQEIADGGFNTASSLESIEKEAIRQRLIRFDGNVRLAAESLGLSRSAFYRRIEKHGL
jgi:DNA-binding NtrC family response regulator